MPAPTVGVPLVGKPPPATGVRTGTAFDRIGGGVIPLGAAVLLYGEPGAGKSSIVHKLALRWCQVGGHVSWHALEENLEAVFRRSERLGGHERIIVYQSSEAKSQISEQKLLLVVDPIQGWAGSHPWAMVRAAEEFVADAHNRARTVLALCRVDKRGRAAGPRDVAHLFDVVLELVLVTPAEHEGPRLLRAEKNRLGPCGEWEVEWPL